MTRSSDINQRMCTTRRGGREERGGERREGYHTAVNLAISCSFKVMRRTEAS